MLEVVAELINAAATVIASTNITGGTAQYAIKVISCKIKASEFSVESTLLFTSFRLLYIMDSKITPKHPKHHVS